MNSSNKSSTTVSHCHICSLPPELVEDILMKLQNVRDLVRMRSICPQIRMMLTKESNLMRILRSFPRMRSFEKKFGLPIRNGLETPLSSEKYLELYRSQIKIEADLYPYEVSNGPRTESRKEAQTDPVLLSSALAEERRRREKAEKELEEKDQQLKEQETQLKEKDKQLQEKDKQLHEKEQQRIQGEKILRDRIAVLERELEAARTLGAKYWSGQFRNFSCNNRNQLVRDFDPKFPLLRKQSPADLRCCFKEINPTMSQSPEMLSLRRAETFVQLLT